MDEHERVRALIERDPDAARQLLQAQVAEQAAENPMLAMVMQMMSAREPRGEDSEKGSPKRERVERVRAHLHELRAALASAHGLLDELAAALGACAACWGGEDDCPACRGRGEPGWRMPDEELFDVLVAPAVARRARTNLGQGRER